MIWFGTDGIRGAVGIGACRLDSAQKLGAGLARFLNKVPAQVLVCRDTRASSSLLAYAASVGILSQGVDVIDGGVCPTPLGAHWGKKLAVDFILVVTASHNFYTDNGYKFIWPSGEKLNSKEQEALLNYVLREHKIDYNSPGQIRQPVNSSEFYLRQLYAGKSLSGKAVLDCAHGAYSGYADRVLREMGVDVAAVASHPDGYNINSGVGSTQADFIRKEVLTNQADYGIAFDGDGDRVVLISKNGRIFSGEDLLWLFILWHEFIGEPITQCVVTEMTPQCFVEACQKKGIDVARVAVGDHHVASELSQRGGRYGGEPSGHVIDMQHLAMCDGLYIAVKALMACQEMGGTLDSYYLEKQVKQQLRQCVFNSSKRSHVEEIVSTSDWSDYSNDFRIIIRCSGTEPLVRILVEGNTAVDRVADEIQQKISEMIADLVS